MKTKPDFKCLDKKSKKRLISLVKKYRYRYLDLIKIYENIHNSKYTYHLNLFPDDNIKIAYEIIIEKANQYLKWSHAIDNFMKEKYGNSYYFPKRD
jgi:hypothetical protein